MSAPIGVVLLSGGLDSATVLAIARELGFSVHALSFRYGQRHIEELEAAKVIAARQGVTRHAILDIGNGLVELGGSALTSDIPVPKGRSTGEIGKEGTKIPVTYVPARNTIFLSFALAYAEVAGAFDIFLGINALDYSGYPDCRPEYLEAFSKLANLATRQGVEGPRPIKLHAPLLYLKKSEIIKKGLELGVDYGLTRSCYDPTATGNACGACDACLLRREGFAQNGLQDPADPADPAP